MDKTYSREEVLNEAEHLEDRVMDLMALLNALPDDLAWLRELNWPDVDNMLHDIRSICISLETDRGS